MQRFYECKPAFWAYITTVGYRVSAHLAAVCDRKRAHRVKVTHVRVHAAVAVKPDDVDALAGFKQI